MGEFFQDKKLNIDIADYWLIIRKRLLHILLVFLLVNALVVSLTLNQRPVFQSTCKIKISTRQPMATIEGAQITWYGAKGNELSSEIQLMSNKTEIIQSVIDVLRKRSLNDSNELDTEAKYYSEQELQYIRAISFSGREKEFVDGLKPETLKSLITLEPIPRSNIVDINVKGPYREFTVACSNVLALVCRADFWRDKTTEAEQTMKFIADQLTKVKGELTDGKTEVEKTAEEKVFLGSAEVYQAELTNLRIQLDRLEERYTPNHPRVIKQKELIRSLERQLAKFPETTQKYDDGVAELESKREVRKKLGEHLITAEINYEAKKLKAKDEIQIIAKAKTARKLKPNVPMNIIAGALFGIILGVISALIWEGLDTSIGKIEDVERITNLPVIAHIPVIGQKGSTSSFFRPIKILWNHFHRLLSALIPFLKKEEELRFDNKIIFNFSSLSVETEAYRTLRTNIHFAIGAKKTTGNVIALTSSNPREGKTLTSTNLAIGLAQVGKTTLLVEADMRCPQIASIFKINPAPGLSDLMIGTATKDEAVRTITDILMGDAEWDKLMAVQGIDNLHLLPSGTCPPNPAELLISPEFAEAIEDFRKHYDFIIIDTPPCLPVSDASIIGRVVDGTVLIYQSDKTSRHLLMRAIQTLLKNEAKLLGIVINQLSFDVIMTSTGSSYGGAYGYGEERQIESEQNEV